MENNDYYVGLMSGTSADAVDLVILDFINDRPSLIASQSTPLLPDIRQKIHSLAVPSDNEIDRLGELDQQLGELFAAGVIQLLQKHKLSTQQIKAIGSHGQTIRHRPPTTVKHPFTLQIGDPNIIAQRTGITTVADFRRRDMAAGGQGAPLVPTFHKAMFQSQSTNRAIVNIGGMANITWLPISTPTCGFDTGPGNVLMDAWSLEKLGKAYDENGQWAASGKPNQHLLQQMLAHPFFAQRAPKSTGREAFNVAWLKSFPAVDQLAPEDVQATLLTLTAQSIVNDIKQLNSLSCEVFICGGGAYNTQLMSELSRLLVQKVSSTAELGIAPQWVEAMAFAWLAKQTLDRKTGNLREVTGADANVILGGVYFA